MTTESIPSISSEAFDFAVAELAQFPGTLNPLAVVVQKMDDRIATIKAQPKSSGNTTALKHWQRVRASFAKGLRLISNGGTPAVPVVAPIPPPAPLPEPKTIFEAIQRLATPEPDLDLSGLITEEDQVADAKSRKRLQSSTNLANKLGETLEKTAKSHAQNYFTIVQKNGNPFDQLDAEPKLYLPNDLVPDGEGDDFVPGKILLVVTSFTVVHSGVIVKRDYRLNGKPAIQSHPEIARIDGNLKIRSSKKVIQNKEFAFYAKAFWVREGDTLYGYLNFNNSSEDDKRFGKHYQIVKGKLAPRR